MTQAWSHTSRYKIESRNSVTSDGTITELPQCIKGR